MTEFEAARVRWQRIVKQHERSQVTIAAFCRQRRVPQSSFYAWRRKLRSDVSHGRRGIAFAEVQLVPEPAVAASALEIQSSNGRCVRVRPGFDRQTLLALLATLEGGR